MTAKAQFESYAPPAPKPGVTLRGPHMISPLSTAIYRDPLPWHPAAGWVWIALLLTDLAALVFARETILATREILFGPMPMSPAFAAASVLWLSMRIFAGLYPGHGVAQPEELKRATTTSVLAALCHLALLVAIQQTNGSRFIALGVWLLLIPMSWAMREAVKYLLVKARWYGYPVIIVGAGKTGRLAIRQMLDNPTLGVIPVAAFDDDPAKHGQLVEGVPVLGAVENALTWRAPYTVRDAIIAIPRASATRVLAFAQQLSQRYRKVGVVTDLFGVGNLWATSRTVGVCSMLEMRHERFERFNLFLKRLFDLVLGIPLFLLSVPVIAVSAALVRLISPGASAFYCQPRLGLNGRRVCVWKIRTMIPDAEQALREHLLNDRRAREQWERQMKLENDPRIIPGLGAFLRRSSIDELPQLWNVVKGDMSLVGPRPFPDYHLCMFSEDFRDLRTQVPPGITGFWQVTHRSASNLEQQQSSDTYYILNWSLWLDLWILFRTSVVVLSGKGAY